MVKCVRCKVLKEESDYYSKKTYCKACHKEANIKSYKKKNKVYKEFDITHIANIDLGFEEGYRDRIEEWFYKDVLPGLEELWLKSKLYKDKYK